MNSHYVLNEITDYREAIAALQSIDISDADTLADLSMQMIATSFDSPYATALNAAIFQRWAEVNVEDAADRTIHRIVSDSSHNHRLLDGLKILASIRPEYLLTKVDCNTDLTISFPIYQGIASNDPEKFANYAISCVRGEVENSFDKEFLPMVVFEWADSDPKAAYDWVQVEAADELQQTDLSPLMWKWFENDPVTAIIEVEKLLKNRDNLSPSDLYRYSEMFARHMASTDPAAACRWVMKQDDPAVKDLLGMVTYDWSETDPEGLRDFVSQLNEDEQSIVAREALDALLGEFWLDDPEPALAWANNLHGEQARELIARIKHTRLF